MALVGEAHIIVRAITNQVQKDIQNAFKDINTTAERAGNNAASSFSRGFERRFRGSNVFSQVARQIQSIVPGAERAREAFQRLVRSGYTLGTALSVVVGGISSVIGGLGALVGAAGGAAASLVVVGNSVFAIASGMIATRLALSGVGKAVQALNKQAVGGGGAAARQPSTRAADASAEAAREAQIAAAERVGDAEEDLARTIERNRDRMVAANEAVRQAQLSLNEALVEGREEIQQIGFEAEDAAIAENEAALELARARETLARVQDLPPNNRARQAAELAFQQADLNLRKAQDRSADLAAEQDRLARTGVKGTNAYVAASQNLAEAEADRAQTVKDVVQDEADARKALTRAQIDQAKAGDRVADANDRLADLAAPAVAAGAAWDEGLNAAQRKFALFIASLKPQFDELERIAAEAFLPKLQTAIETLMRSAYPVVATGIGLVAGAMGDAAISLADAITGTQALANLGTVFESSATLIQLMGSAAGSLWEAAIALLAGASGQAERFFTFLDDRLNSFAGWIQELEANGQLAAFFQTAGDMAAKFGDIFGNIFGGFGAIIMANFGPGTGGWQMLTWLQEATQKFADLGNTPEKMAGLKDFFVGVSDNFIAISQSVGELVGGLLALGDNPAIGETFAALERGAPFLVSIVEKSIEAGPALGNLVATLVEIIDKLTDTGAIDVFFGTLQAIAQVVSDFLGNDVVMAIMTVTGQVFAFLSAIGLVGSIGLFGFKAVSGMVMNTAGHIGKVIDATKIAGSAFSALSSGGVGAAFKTIQAGFKGGADGAKTYAATVRATAGANAAAAGGVGILKGAFTALGGGIASATRSLALMAASPVFIAISAIVAVVGLLVAAFVGLYKTNEDFRKQIDAAWGEISAAFSEAGSQIMSALNPLIDVFTQLVTVLAPVVGMLVESLVPVFVLLVNAIAPLVSLIIQALVPIISTLVSALAPLITLLAQVLTPVIQVVVGVLGFLINIIVEVLKVVITVFTAIVTFIIDTLTVIITGILDFITSFGTNWNNFWDGVFTVISDIWTNIQNALNAVWQWINDYIFKPIVDAVNWVSDGFEFAGKVIALAWQIMQNQLNAVFKWIDTYIFGPIRAAVKWVSDAFEFAGELIGFAWKKMQQALFDVFKWIDDNVFTPIKNAVDLVQQAFELVGEGIAKAWEGIKAAAAAPVNFVIDTVYNNGLRSFWNGIAGNLGMNDLKLDRVPTIAFAKGGVLPGYTPGRDVHDFYSRTGGRLRLSGGEAIMRPEWTRAVGGPAAVERMNRAARRGQAFANGGVFNGPRTQSFATGGVVDFGEDLLKNLGKVAEIVGDFFINPANAVQKHLVDGLIKPLSAGAGDNMFAKIVTGVPVKMASWLGDSVAKFFGADNGAVKGGAGMGWQAMWNIVKNQFPSATLNSSLRPGSPGYHGKGRAIDTSPRMDIFNFLRSTFPNSRELIYSPANNLQLQNGKNHLWSEPVRSAHFNHVHWAMAKGGTVSPSSGGTMVQVAEAGRAERIEPLHPNGLSDRDLALIDRLSGDVGNVEITVVTQPGQSNREIAEEVSEILARKRRRGGI